MSIEKKYECTNYKKTWTEEELATLISMKKSGDYYVHTMSKHLNRTLKSVSGKIAHLKKQGRL